MQRKLTLALAAAVIAFASCALAGNGSRNNEFTSETAQYCIPQYDSSGVQRAPYC
jgi:hypothetical protein